MRPHSSATNAPTWRRVLGSSSPTHCPSDVPTRLARTGMVTLFICKYQYFGLSMLIFLATRGGSGSAQSPTVFCKPRLVDTFWSKLFTTYLNFISNYFYINFLFYFWYSACEVAIGVTPEPFPPSKCWRVTAIWLLSNDTRTIVQMINRILFYVYFCWVPSPGPRSAG